VGFPCNSKSCIVADALFIDLLFQHQSGYSTGRLGKKMLRQCIPPTINPDYLRMNNLNAMRIHYVCICGPFGKCLEEKWLNIVYK
jgi:hypothetical protein